jgi:hypothetical protein
MYTRRVDPSISILSLSSHCHSYIELVFSLVLALSIHNKFQTLLIKQERIFEKGGQEENRSPKEIVCGSSRSDRVHEGFEGLQDLGFGHGTHPE